MQHNKHRRVRRLELGDKQLVEMMKVLHEELVPRLDPDLVKAVCPKGWRLDYTEHAGCELRRFQEAKKAIGDGKQPRRGRDKESKDTTHKHGCVVSGHMLSSQDTTMHTVAGDCS